MRFDTRPWDNDYDAEAHRAECQRMHATNKLKGQMANDSGHLMEKQILTAAEEYLLNGIAKVIKVPEPFRVAKKYRNGKAQSVDKKEVQNGQDFDVLFHRGRLQIQMAAEAGW